MGISLNVALREPVPPHGTLSDDHMAIGNGIGRLDRRLTRAGLRPLSDFVSGDPADYLDEDDPLLATLPGVQWFPAADGLVAVRAAVTHLRTDGGAADLVGELESVAGVLAAAADRGVEFYFALLD